MMITVNSDQIVAAGNLVINFLVPVVLIRGGFAGVCRVTIDMATMEVKPKKKKGFFFEKEEKNLSFVSRVCHDIYDSIRLAKKLSLVFLTFLCAEILLEY